MGHVLGLLAGPFLSTCQPVGNGLPKITETPQSLTPNKEEIPLYHSGDPLDQLDPTTLLPTVLSQLRAPLPPKVGACAFGAGVGRPAIQQGTSGV